MFKKVILFSSIILVLAPASAKALSSDQINVFNLGIRYFNTETQLADSCGVDVSPTLNGNDNPEKAFNFFVQQLNNTVQAAGIVGNLKWESGVDPTKKGGGGDSDTPTNVWGIAQWTESSGRIGKLEDYAKQHNESIDDLATQLGFAWAEMQAFPNFLDHLKATTTPDEAAAVVFNEYEIPGDDTLPGRQSMARDIYRGFGGQTDGNTVSAPSSDGQCTSVGPGQSTQYVDGFTVYSQYDPQWASDPYGSSTIADSGCGPSAMAMIITNLTGKQVTPDITAAYAAGQGLYVPGVGSSWSIGKVLAEHWGLNATFIGADVSKITAALQAGSLVITSGEGGLPFTTHGHFIVIRGVTADGQWKVGDSAHTQTNTQSWDPQQLIANMNSGSVYAISK